MSNIQGYLQKIMQAVYGKDVRQSIHDAIEAVDSVADTAKDSATASAKKAEIMADNAGKYADEAQVCVVAVTASETNAKASEAAAKASEDEAKASESNAKVSQTAAEDAKKAAATSETNAKASEVSASESAATATEKATSASESADIATEKADIATQKASEIIGKAESAAASATKAESYAVGGTGSREGEDTDNAQYYYEQIKRVSQGLNGIIPMGTVAFADLPASGMENGWMYNISDDFTSDDRFNDGGGIYYGKGNNVIWTSEGKWDVTAGSGVTGIKGNKEKTYRQGNVNLTPEDIGAVAEDGDASDTTVAFASSDTPDADASAWTSVATLISGEKHASLFAKVSQMFKNIRYLYKILGSTDISSIGGGTVTGAISSQNKALTQLNNYNSGLLTHVDGTKNNITIPGKGGEGTVGQITLDKGIWLMCVEGWNMSGNLGYYSMREMMTSTVATSNTHRSYGVSMTCVAVINSKETIPLRYTNWGDTAVAFSSADQPGIYAYKLQNI